MTQNVKFKYLYRDGSNYKNSSSIIFANPDDLSIDLVYEQLANCFFQGQLFIADQIKIRELFFEDYPASDDISFHEFDNVDFTNDVANDTLARTITDFISQIELESAKGWKAFDPQERLYHFQ